MLAVFLRAVKGWPVGGGLHPATDGPFPNEVGQAARLSAAILGRWDEGFVSVSFGSASRRDARASLGLGSGRAGLITVLAVAR